MEITQFYVPNSNMKLKLFKNINNDFIDTKDLLELIHQTDDNPLPAGIWYWAKWNRGFYSLLEMASVADHSNEVILWEMKTMYASLLALRDFTSRPINIDLRSSQIDSKQKQKIIYLRLVEKLNISSIGTKTRFDQDQINEILSDFMAKLKLVKTQEQADRLQQKTNRVRNDEEEIKKWVQTLQDQKYTISHIRNSIYKNKESQHKVSNYRIRKTLRILWD